MRMQVARVAQQQQQRSIAQKITPMTQNASTNDSMAACCCTIR